MLRDEEADAKEQQHEERSPRETHEYVRAETSVFVAEGWARPTIQYIAGILQYRTEYGTVPGTRAYVTVPLYGTVKYLPH